MPEPSGDGRGPMASAPMKYCPDGSVDWGNMWDSFCALAQDDGPPHRGTMLYAPEHADVLSAPYRFAATEIARGIERVSGLTATPAGTGWLAVACDSPAMAGWLAAAIDAERVQARAEDRTLFVPVGEWPDVTKEIKNVITVVAKTTHYWADHLPSAGAGLVRVGGGIPPAHVKRVHTEPAVLDIGGDMGSLVIYTPSELNGAEIELIPRGAWAKRTHVDVAERRHNGQLIFAAVYPPLPAGDYAIWVDYATPRGEVTIRGGEVAQLDWRA